MSLSSKEYFIRETGKSIKRNGVMSIASVSTVAVSLLVLGLFLLLFLNTDNLAKYLESQVQMTVYMDDSASADDLSAMERKLRALPGVVQVKEVTKDQAMERFRERLGDQASLLKALGTDNPFPASFEIQVDQPSRIRELVPVVSEMPKVETAKFGQEVVEHLFALTKILRIGGAVLIVFLCLATLFIIANTIRLTVFARRKEVTIMRYVGATDWFIRWPFLLEGMCLGFGGALIASVLVDIIYTSLMSRIYLTLAFFPILPAWPTLLFADLFILACGTFIGALGSHLSLKKFLRV
ncbi:MAG: permease-like cell division protein FtsX [Succiniclasticum sp.]|jgi:cell division transport system permease protein